MTEHQINILFVDDEQNILNGLKRMLHGMRREWKMEFCLGGKEALKLMKTHPFDIVLSDMRMPEMDGAELLSKIKKQYPHVICIILSGHSDKEMILRTIGPADQFLSKPCSAELLKENISRVISIRQHLIYPPKHFSNLLRMEPIQLLPSHYNELFVQLENQNTSLDQLINLISMNPMTTAKILQLVNSSFFGLGRETSDLKQAINLLAIDNLRLLLLSTDLFKPFNDSDVEQLQIKKLYQHSAIVGQIAKEISQSLPKEKQGSCITASLLYNFGRFVLAQNAAEQYKKLINDSSGSIDSILMSKEEQIFGISHFHLGYLILSRWNIPKDIISASMQVPERKTFSEWGSPAVVYTANALYANALGKTADFSCLEKLDIFSKLHEWKEATKTIMGKVKNNECFI